MSARKSDEPTVFLIEDDSPVRNSLALVLELSDLRVEAFASATEFLSQNDPTRRGCLVLDVHLPGMSGVELHQHLLDEGIGRPTIFLTGHAPPNLSEEFRQQGVVAVFEKPCPPEVLVETIRHALKQMDRP
jgi:FixJ family two-component response regulator